MAISSAFGAQSTSGVVWAQIQQQQAQRAADQAEQNARSLKIKAKQAEVDASRAQEEARTANIESDKAQSKAGNARQNLVSLESARKLQEGLQAVRDKIADSTLVGANSSTSSSEAPSAAGVTNAYGQQTGTLVNVTA